MGGKRANNLTRRGAIAAASATAALGFARPLFAAGEPRVALLVGNRAYAPEVGTLVNPIRDVALVSKTLIDAGFAADDIVVATNATRKTFEKALDDYHAKLVKAGSNAIGVVYYCGHGAANMGDGKSYLIPVDAPTARTAALWTASITTQNVFDRLSRFSGLQLVLLDCCRNELAFDTPPPPPVPVAGAPTVTVAQGPTRGFVAVRDQRPQNMFISYAAWEGETASDGAKGATNGPYAVALADSIRSAKAKANVVQLFDEVRLRVLTSTSDTQEPMNLSRTSTTGAAMKPFAAGSSAVPVEKRAKPRALVIGNTYAANKNWHLPSATADAERVRVALEKSAFHAERATGVSNKAAFFERLSRFAKTLGNAVGVVYLCGRGCGIVGSNYILPDGVSIKRDEDMLSEGIPVMEMVNVLLRSQTRAIFIALDCARPIDLNLGARSIEAGLEDMKKSQKNVVVSYSAIAGGYVKDEFGPSVYAASLAAQIERKDRRSLQQIAKAVEFDVLTKTKTQRPWFQDATDVPIYFRDDTGLIGP